MASAVGSKTELLNVLGDVKARIQDKLGVMDFPMPQFILIGKQSVGKSRLIEAMAGEAFNFISGTLGSRRPTVLEFRNVASVDGSRWYVRDMESNLWQEHPVSDVMKIVGNAHETLGQDVSDAPINVRIESPACVDVQIVDLPGFRDFALDEEKKVLASKIHDLVHTFMQDPRNVMLCVEQAGDAATMSTLAKCREIDPEFKRTVLIRNKLDKYYKDLTSDNVNQWADGFGDLPPSLERFAMTLPFWMEGSPAPKSLTDLREDMNEQDIKTMGSIGMESKYLKTIGFKNFSVYMEQKIQDLFVKALGPVLDVLKTLKEKHTKTEKSLAEEYETTEPTMVANTTRACGVSFAAAVNELMEGQLSVMTGCLTIEEELLQFHEFHTKALSSGSFLMLPSEDFCGLEEYTEYLTNEANVGVATMKEGKAVQIPLNGGAQWRRLMAEVEIFLRFSEIAVQTKKRDVIQARGVSMTSLTWRDVVVKLLSNEAHLPLQRRVRYVAERLKWFFSHQKEAILDFMVSLEDQPSGGMYTANFPKHGKLIRQNEMIKHMVFETYDRACDRQLHSFVELFENMLTSTFSNPWVFLKGATSSRAMEEGLPEDASERIPLEIQSRSGVDSLLNKWLQDIPTEAHQIDEAVDKVQQLVLKTYSFIRSQVCDQVELLAESFFKIPMLRRLNADMSTISLSASDQEKYDARRQRLDQDKKVASDALKEIVWCIDRLQNFKLKTEAKGTRM